MTAKARARALSFIAVAFASMFVFAAPANAEDSSTTVVPTVPVPIVPIYDSGSQVTETTIKLTPAIGAADPSTKSAPIPVETIAPQRPSVQATTPVVIPNRSSNTGSGDNVTLKPVVEAPQIGGNTDATSVEVTRVAPQMIIEAPATSVPATSAPSTPAAEPAAPQQLTDPIVTTFGPDAVWGYLGYGIAGALAALAAFRVNVRRSRPTA
jgi:hypothetical protein